MGNNRQLDPGLEYYGYGLWCRLLLGDFSCYTGRHSVLQVGTLANNQFEEDFQYQHGSSGLSVSYSGDCYGIYANTPYGYYQYQQQTAEFGSGPNVSALQVTFKNWAYAITDEPTIGGNRCMLG